MGDDSFKAARLEALRVDTELKRYELSHKLAGDQTRLYHFPSIIIAETVDTCIEVLQHWIDMDPDTPMTVAFNSPGGVVFEGFALFDFIADHVERGLPIDTSSYGKCASMAAVCLQAGRYRSLHRNSFFMVHEVDSFVSGTMQSLKDQLTFTTKLQERIEEVLVSRTGGLLTQELLHDRTMHKDWWLTPDEALDYGFIDFIAN